MSEVALRYIAPIGFQQGHESARHIFRPKLKTERHTIQKESTMGMVDGSRMAMDAFNNRGSGGRVQ